jgi:hypothetical protein
MVYCSTKIVCQGAATPASSDLYTCVNVAEGKGIGEERQGSYNFATVGGATVAGRVSWM